jgi:hypothetical protein
MDRIDVSFVAICERYTSCDEDQSSCLPAWLNTILDRDALRATDLARLQQSARTRFDPNVTDGPETVLADPTSVVLAQQTLLEGLRLSNGVLVIARWTAWFKLALRPGATQGWLRDGRLDRDGDMIWFERFSPISLEDGLQFLIGEEGRWLGCDLDGTGELSLSPDWPPISLG